MQLNYDAEYNLNYRFEIESCCNLTGNPRDLHVTQAGGFGFFLTRAGGFGFSHSEMSNRNAIWTDSLID